MTAPTDDHLRELLALWSGPGVIIAEGHLIRALAEEVLALREIHAAAQGVIAAIPAALDTARRETLEEAAALCERRRTGWAEKAADDPVGTNAYPYWGARAMAADILWVDMRDMRLPEVGNGG